VKADKSAEDHIDCQNLRYSGSRLRPSAVSAAEDNIVMVVVAVVLCESHSVDRGWIRRERGFRDGICLPEREVLCPYILGGMCL
jgi:hypothetical protein